MKKIGLRPPSRVQIRHPHQRGHRMTITQRLHCSISNIYRMRYRLVPVRILITHSGKDLIQMVHVRVPNISPKYFIPLILLKTVLDVVCIEVIVALRGRRAEHQFARDEVLAGVLHCEGRIRKFRVERQGRGNAGHESDRVDPGVQQGLEGPEEKQ